MISLGSLKMFMTHAPYSISPEMTIRVALEMMRRHGIRHLPVEEEDRLVGLLSDRHIIASERDGRLEPVLDLAVSEIMDREPLRLGQDIAVEEAIRRMRSQHSDGIVAIDGHDELAGIFTERDALGILADLLAAGAATSPTQNAGEASIAARPS